MNFWKDLSIQRKLVFAMALALVLSLSLSAWLGNVFTSNILKQRLSQYELPYLLSSLKLEVEKEVSLAINTSKQIAESQFVIDWLKQNDLQSDVDSIQRYLARLNNANQADETFIGSNISHDYFTQKGFTKTMSKSETNDNWFFSFFSNDKEYDTGIGPNKDTGELTLFINHRVKDSGTVLGVAGMGVSMQRLVDFINNFKLGDSGQVYLVSADGTYKIHRDQSLVDKAKLSQKTGMSEIAANLLASEEFSLNESSWQGENYFVASDYIPELDWYFIAEIPQNEVYDALNTASRNSLLTTFFVALVFILLSVVVAKGISAPILQISKLLNEVAQGQGDLTQRLPEGSKDELGALATSFNAFISQLQLIIQQIVSNCQQLLVSVEEVNGLSQQTSADLLKQNDKTIQVATAITQMGATIEDIARNASEAAGAAEQAATKVNEGNSVVGNTISYIEKLSAEMQTSGDAINELAAHTIEIGSILSVIKGISEQTNLLALNAAIEAARAGEQGRGFAVVADEVRSLSLRTQTSTQEIQTMIQKLQEGSNSAVNTIESGKQQTELSVEASTRAGDALSAIDESVKQIKDMSFQMATATEEQSVVVNDISSNVTEINNVTNSSTKAAEQTLVACKQLRNLTEDLSQLVNKFKV